MAPLKDTFGEGWVDSDVDEGSIAANSVASEPLKTEKMETTKAVEGENVVLKQPSMQLSQSQNLDQRTGDILEVLKVRACNENKNNKCYLKRGSLEEAICKESGELSEHLMKSEEMQSSNFGGKERDTLKQRPSDYPNRHLGGARGRETRKSILKRVKSEANFIRGRVAVSTIACIQEVKSTTEGDDQIITDEEEGEKNEENSVEVEVTLKNWSNVQQEAIMEGKEMLLVCIPPWSLRKANVHTLARESVDRPLMTLEMHPKSLESKTNNMKAGQMHPQVLETTEHPPGKPSEPTAAVQTIPPQSQTHAKISTSNKVGLHPERARASSKAQSKIACRAQKPLKTSEELHKEVQTNMIPCKAKESAQGQLKKLNFIPMAREALLQRMQGGGKRQANAGLLEVKEVECECCGMGEECTTGYAEHVKGIFSGHWVCGLCAEAIYEERHRLGKGIPMEEAVCTHMNLCKQFSSMKKAGGPPHSPGVAHAVCHLLSRHLGDPASPRTTPVRPFLRTISCLPSL